MPSGRTNAREMGSAAVRLVSGCHQLKYLTTLRLSKINPDRDFGYPVTLKGFFAKKQETLQCVELKKVDAKAQIWLSILSHIIHLPKLRTLEIHRCIVAMLNIGEMYTLLNAKYDCDVDDVFHWNGIDNLIISKQVDDIFPKANVDRESARAVQEGLHEPSPMFDE